MPETTLEILSERRKPVVLLDRSGKVATLERIERGAYRELEVYDDIRQYADATPADTSKEYLRQVNEHALLDYTDHYYETRHYKQLLAVIGYMGLELAFRHTRNGARFSTLEPAGGGLHTHEHFLSVAPSIYDSLCDANDTIGRRYGEELQADNY